MEGYVSSRSAGEKWCQSRLTLSEDKIVGLDELVKCVLGKLANIGVGSRGIGSQSSHKAAGDLLVVHDGLSGWGYPRKHKERASL